MAVSRGDVVIMMDPDESMHLRTLRQLRERVARLGATARATVGTSQYMRRKREWLAALDELRAMEQADAEDREKKKGTA